MGDEPMEDGGWFVKGGVCQGQIVCRGMDIKAMPLTT